MKKSILVFLISFLSSIGYAQEEIISSEIKEHIKARVDAGVNVGIVVGLLDDDKVEYFSAGKTAIDNGVDVNEHSVFEIGSISKVFTTVLLADKVLQGKMKLTDPISDYLPKQVKVPSRNGKQITLLDLATHSSGLPRMPNNFTPANPNNPFVDYTNEQVYSFLSNYTLTRDIGEKYEYSNYGMGLLGHILELQSGKDYETLVKTRIANSLKMNDTRLLFTEAMKSRLAKGHSGLQEVENWDIISLGGAGGIRSTASDMVKFLKANLGLKKTRIYKAMQLSHLSAYKNVTSEFEMGLGWHYENDKSVIWHNGRTGGYTAFIGFLKDSKKAVVVLSNSTEDIGALAFKLLGSPTELVTPKKSMAMYLKKEISENGIEAAKVFYDKVKKETAEAYAFNEGEFNALGYTYLNQNQMDTALMIFKWNVNEHPEASNPYDSLGEAFLKAGDSTLAISNYKKSLELNPANENAKQVLEKLGLDPKILVKTVVVPVETLETYVGVYQLSPAFKITVSRTGSQLFVQATAQPQFEVFPSTHNNFYLKVVDANVTFNRNEKGMIDSLTLHQGGQNVPGKKVE